MLVCCSYSYCEIITGTTPNAVDPSLTWNPVNALPPQAGLTVNGLIYRYTAVKETNDPLVVNIYNYDAVNGGYVFNKTDNWSGLPGNTISNYTRLDVPLLNIGTAGIKYEGIGTIENPYVAYNYTYDTCYDPMTDPRCPGYAEKMASFTVDYSLTINDPLNDEMLKYHMERETIKPYDNIEFGSSSSNNDEEKKKRAEEAAKNALLTADAVTQAALLFAMSIPNFDSYYYVIPGGVYNDVLHYEDKKIPENKRGLRVGLAQQLLHEKMIESQYK